MKKKSQNIIYFFLLLILTTLLFLLFEIILNVEQKYNLFLSENLLKDEVDKILENRQKWIWLNYVLVYLLLLLKIFIISAIIDMGCFFYNKKIKFQKIFNIVVKAEFVFFLVIIFKIGWFYFFKKNYTIEDLQYFYPLSALNIVGYEGIHPWFIYPFQVINIFELVYWLILAYLINKEINDNTEKGFSIVASSYGVSLFLWVIIVMFFTLNMN